MEKFFIDWAKTAKTAKFKGLENLALYGIAMQYNIIVVVPVYVATGLDPDCCKFFFSQPTRKVKLASYISDYRI